MKKKFVDTPAPCDCCDVACPAAICEDGTFPLTVQWMLQSNSPWTSSAGIAGTSPGQQSIYSPGAISALQAGLTLARVTYEPLICLAIYRGYTTAQSYTAYSWGNPSGPWNLWGGTGSISGITNVYGAAEFQLTRNPTTGVISFTGSHWLAWL